LVKLLQKKSGGNPVHVLQLRKTAQWKYTAK